MRGGVKSATVTGTATNSCLPRAAITSRTPRPCSKTRRWPSHINHQNKGSPRRSGGPPAALSTVSAGKMKTTRYLVSIWPGVEIPRLKLAITTTTRARLANCATLNASTLIISTTTGGLASASALTLSTTRRPNQASRRPASTAGDRSNHRAAVSNAAVTSTLGRAEKSRLR